MLDQIITTLKEQAGPQLRKSIGLNEQQANGSILAAADSLKEVVGAGAGGGMTDLLNLFSDAKNTSGADGILSNLGNVLNGKLTGQVGLNSDQAGAVGAMLLPMLTNLLSSKIGGNAANLQKLLGGLTGGSGGGVADIAQGFIGKLFK